MPRKTAVAKAIDALPFAESPPAVVAARKVWDGYQSALTTYQATLRVLNGEAEAVTGNECLLGVAGRHKMQDLLLKVARDLEQMLVDAAEKEFGSRAARLTIDTDALHEALPLEKDRYDDDREDDVDVRIPFSPEQVWDWLRARYGNGAGERTALRQVAERLDDVFRFSRDVPQPKSGYLVFNMSVYCDSWRKKYDKRNEISYQSAQHLGRGLLALRDFALATNRADLAIDLVELAERFHGNRLIESRAKYGLGEDRTELLVITYLDRFEFRLRQQTAEALQLFLGSHLGG